MAKINKEALSKELGTLDKKTIMLIDEALYQEHVKIVDSIRHYNEQVGLLNAHASMADINRYDLKCRYLIKSE